MLILESIDEHLLFMDLRQNKLDLWKISIFWDFFIAFIQPTIGSLIFDPSVRGKNLPTLNAFSGISSPIQM